ncbi:MAG TPA: adenosine deaminase [Candidatus Acidoferrum sp.]|nr:adenosine deaminase [Candidatus Acidoferrum sp.]
MEATPFFERIASLPKAELHLHLEGSIRPAIASALAARHGLDLEEAEVRRRYAYTNFAGFLDAFKWVTSFVREPKDFALIAADLGEQLIEQKVVYAEVTLSVGVMFLRQQQPEANFAAIVAATEPFEKRGLRLNWIFDAVRQFGAEAAMGVVQAARRCASRRIVAFGIGGDELSLPAAEFRGVYERAEEYGFHRLMHAGEIGGPEKIREAIEILGVERIGHGIAAIRDAALMETLAERKIPLEICPASNLRTGALGVQLGKDSPTMGEHPLGEMVRRGVAVTISTDDPAMFHTSLEEEYRNALGMGLTEEEILSVAENGFRFAFGEAR